MPAAATAAAAAAAAVRRSARVVKLGSRNGQTPRTAQEAGARRPAAGLEGDLRALRKQADILKDETAIKGGGGGSSSGSSNMMMGMDE